MAQVTYLRRQAKRMCGEGHSNFFIFSCIQLPEMMRVKEFREDILSNAYENEEW